MKKLLSILLLLVVPAVYAESVSIRADEWFPMNGDPKGARKGYMIDLAEEIFSQAGYTLDYKIMPWERALKSVRSGEFDCVVGAYKEDAPDFLFPQQSWGMDRTGYYVTKSSSWTFNGFDSLLQQKVGVISGYAYGDEFDNLVASRQDVFKAATGNDALEKNFKKLKAGRLDVVVESVAVANAKLQELGMQGDVKLAGSNPKAAPLYIACSPAKPGSKTLVTLIDKGTEQLRASGKLKQILAKYGLEDWQ